jgi:hypothetical protein
LIESARDNGLKNALPGKNWPPGKQRESSRFLSDVSALPSALRANTSRTVNFATDIMRQSLNPQDRTPKVYVIHENDDWVIPLRQNFAARGIPFVSGTSMRAFSICARRPRPASSTTA